VLTREESAAAEIAEAMLRHDRDELPFPPSGGTFTRQRESRFGIFDDRRKCCMDLGIVSMRPHCASQQIDRKGISADQPSDGRMDRRAGLGWVLLGILIGHDRCSIQSRSPDWHTCIVLHWVLSSVASQR
jgi:hypothetical protein